MTFQKVIPKDLTTSNTSRPSEPDIIIPNPLKRDIFVNGIELILTPEFSKKGRISILVNEVSVLDGDDSFEGYSKFPIHLGKVLKRGNDIEIYVWNDEDTNTIRAKCNTSLSAELQPFDSQAVPLPRDVFNKVVSESIQLFETRDYLEGEVITKPLHLEGYQKFWALMSAQSYTPPTVINNTDWSTPEQAVDGSLGSYSQGQMDSGLHTEYFDVDLGHVASKFTVDIFFQALTGNSNTPCTGILTVQYKEEESDPWTDANSYPISSFYPGNGNVILNIDDDFEVNARYVRIKTDKTTSTGTIVTRIQEIYDTSKFGGTASLSFLLKAEDGQLFEIIPASEFGTITQGSAISVQIGDTLDKTYGLFQSQSDLLARLTITSGGINTGVSIKMVA